MNVNALIFERMDWIKHRRCLLNWYHDYNVCEILIKKSQGKIPIESVDDSAVTNLPLYQSNYMLMDLEGYIDKLSIHYTLTFKAIHVASWQMEEAFVKKRKTASELFIKTQIIVKQQKYTIKTFLLHTCIRTKIVSVPESAHCFSYGFMITRRRSFFFLSYVDALCLLNAIKYRYLWNCTSWIG